MKIGFLTYGMEHSLTGIGRYTVELTRALRRLDPGLEITLLNPYPESELDWYQEFPNRMMPQLKRIYSAASLGNLQLHQAAQQLGLDILHDPCGIAPFISPRGRYRRITTVHDAVPLVYPATQPLATRLIFKTLVPAARWTSDAVITVSQASAHDLVTRLRLPAERIHVTLCGVRQPAQISGPDIEEVIDRLQLPRRFLVYVGALHPRKNLGGVLDAYAQLRRQIAGTALDDVALVIVGPASWGFEARAKLGLTFSFDGVHFTGYVTDHDLSALYFSTLGLVYPSFYEGFGLPALEALAHGAPVITSNTSSLPEVVGDAALKVDPADSSAIAAAMYRLVSEPHLRKDLSERGPRHAAAFTWDRTARQTLSVYTSVLKQR